METGQGVAPETDSYRRFLRGKHLFSPFAGIGSEGYQSLKMGRRYLGFELKRNYWEQACKNLATVERDGSQRTLFDVAPGTEVEP